MGETLISCSEDGSICLWKLSDDPTKGHYSHSKVRSEADRLNVECLILRGDWLNHNRRLDNAVLHVDEVKRQTQLQIQIMEQESAQQCKAIEDEHDQQLERANRQIQVFFSLFLRFHNMDIQFYFYCEITGPILSMKWLIIVAIKVFNVCIDKG